jgi:hypothetical protein
MGFFYCFKMQSKAHSKNSEKLLKFIASELVTTEETYLSHLKTIKKVNSVYSKQIKQMKTNKLTN